MEHTMAGRAAGTGMKRFFPAGNQLPLSFLNPEGPKLIPALITDKKKFSARRKTDGMRVGAKLHRQRSLSLQIIKIRRFPRSAILAYRIQHDGGVIMKNLCLEPAVPVP